MSAYSGGVTTSNGGLPPKASVFKPTKKKEIKIILVGETGVGKTAFMSLLVNLFQGRGPFELEKMHLPENEAENGQKGTSRTKNPILYTVKAENGAVLRILDTPGLADARGIDFDHTHRNAINNEIRNNFLWIDAVMIHVTTKFALSTVAAMFPSSITHNIGFVFTHSTKLGQKFQMDMLESELRSANSWVIQNPLAILQEFRRREASGFSQKQLDPDRKTLQNVYDGAVTRLGEWVQWLDQCEEKPTLPINDLYKSSTSIESNIESSLSSLVHLAEKSRLVEDAGKELKSVENVKADLKREESRQTEYFWDKETTLTPNTICFAPNCYRNCHTPCELNLMKTADVLANTCGVFSKRKGPSTPCDVCGHPAEEHAHYPGLHVQKQGQLDQETKRKLDEATSAEQKQKMILDLAQADLDKLNRDAKAIRGELRRQINLFNKLSLSRSFEDGIRSALVMLEERKKAPVPPATPGEQLMAVEKAIEDLKKKLEFLTSQKF